MEEPSYVTAACAVLATAGVLALFEQWAAVPGTVAAAAAAYVVLRPEEP